ncbi:tetratricopeptide repeat protein [Streptomyces sp. NPDC060205]|uniref:tetratricopeptide repeat protein n=1 Tax=Streptomyces sp. NPDC060205 TaxID=3347072 RepID=UPI003651ED3F
MHIGQVVRADGGIAASRIDYHAPPRMPVPFPHQVGLVPGTADCFQDRAALHTLGRATADGGTAVLVGMGGVGKTQLAARHARTCWESGELDLLMWVTATTREAVMTAYSSAAAALLGADPGDSDRAVSGFLVWLAARSAVSAGATDHRWLIVLDDVPHLATLTGLWPPTTPHGRTLITTRNRDAAFTARGRHRIGIDLFTDAEATNYLTAKLTTHHRHDDPAHIQGLARDLGHLPLALALAQTVPYMVNKHLDCAAYRQRLADHRRTLPTLLADPTGLPDDQRDTVAAAWRLSIDLADQLPPVGLASPLLRLAAMLVPYGIPADVLTSPAALAHLSAHRRTPAGPAVLQALDPDEGISVEDVTDALGNLHQLSLIDYTPDVAPQTVRIHQLVQRATRDRLTGHDRHELARTAGDALTAAWPDVERDTHLAQALRSNTTTLVRHGEDALYQPHVHPILFRAGTSLGEAGQITTATAYYRHLTQTARHRLGPDHLDTLTARGHLAYWRGHAGDAAGAASTMAELLADVERVLGHDHPNAFATRHHLARWRGQAGNAASAATAFAHLLTDVERVLGPDHPHTLATRGHLAYWQGHAGDAASAARTMAQLLTDAERVFGPDHPGTLIARGHLARWQGHAGDTTGAVSAMAELLTDRVRVLGPDHPDTLATLATRGDLAHWREKNNWSPCQ